MKREDKKICIFSFNNTNAKSSHKKIAGYFEPSPADWRIRSVNWIQQQIS